MSLKLSRKNKRKTNRGITLIALVITIIVLLILAGVTIATLTGDNRTAYKSRRCKKYFSRCRNRRRNKNCMEQGLYG